MKAWQLPFVFILVLCAVLCGSPKALLAQGTRMFQQEALSLFKQGKQLAIKKQYKRALIKYVAAQNLLERAERSESSARLKRRYRNIRVGLLYVIGQTYQYDGQVYKAYKSYISCLRAKPSGKLAKITNKRLAQVRPQVQASVTIQVLPAGSDITLRDSEGRTYKGATPLSQMLNPGPLQITLQAKGYKTRQIKLSLRPKQSFQKLFTLKPAQRVALRRPVKPKAPSPPPSRSSGSIYPSLMWTGIVVAVAAGITGGVMLGVGLTQEQSARGCQGNATSPDCKDQTSDTIASGIESGQTLQGLGWGLAAVGILAAGGAVLFAALATKTGEQKSASLHSFPSGNATQGHRSHRHTYLVAH